MFKKTLYTIPLVFFTLVTAAFAQPIDEKKYFITRQDCQNVVIIMNNLVSKYNETPLFLGDTIQFDPSGNTFTGNGMFFVNQDTGTWTLLTLYSDSTACVTAVGTKFEPYTDNGRR